MFGIDADVLSLFALAAIVLLITPGPAIIYIIARSVSQGTVAGLVASVGMHVGTFVHVAAAAWGLSQLLLTSATAFNVVKYLGAAYLIYLGIRSFVRRGGDPAPGANGGPERKELFAIFRESILVNVLNPKTALIFFAFLPQFVHPGAPAGPQLALLAVTFVVLAIGMSLAYALAAGSIGRRIERPGPRRVLDRFGGTLLIAAGVLTATLRRA